MSSPNTVVVGLDGAHFEILEPWIDAGELPNLQRIFESGLTSDLESVLPPVTSPNWKAYSTGKNPGKFGIFWWENIDLDEKRVYYPEDRKHNTIELWEILAQDSPVGVIGVPTTHPPKSINGFVVSGAPDGDNTGYASPPEVEKLLDRKLDYRVMPEHRINPRDSESLSEIYDVIDSRFRAAKLLADEYDLSFLQVTTFYINVLQHFLWRSEDTLKGWKIIDNHIGEFLDDETDVILMSDHGSTKIDTVFHINTWLANNGYLSVNTGISSKLQELGLSRERIGKFVDSVGVGNLARNLAPDRLLNSLPDEQGELKRGQKTNHINWTDTLALASGQGPVYINAPKDSKEYHIIREKLIDELTDIRGPSGTAVAKEVVKGEDIYSGPYLDEAPDLCINQTPGVHIQGGIGRNEIFSNPSDGNWRAENKRNGLFAALGPSFRSGSIDGLSILDLTPTILHLYGNPIPSDMDGCVRKDVFSPESGLANRDIEYTDSYEYITEIARIRNIARDSPL
ncbi:alkaline phosphatase family protein [Halocalculus aciditolerans]|nr:alkaline phosphatase family protein [Halocalculus aciditolerans]